MLRVLLVIEDYGEMMFLQTVLKKIGFDVDAIQNPRLFNDTMITLNPEVVVLTAYGKRVKGLEMSRNMKRLRGMPRVILLRGPGQISDQDPGIDLWLPSPVAATDLLAAIANLCGLNKDTLNEKFQKLRAQEELSSPELRVLKSTNNEGSDTQFVGSILQPSSLGDNERRERYQKFLKDQPPKEHGFAVKEVQQFVKTLRSQESPETLEDLEKERRAFVEHLFKKKA